MDNVFGENVIKRSSLPVRVRVSAEDKKAAAKARKAERELAAWKDAEKADDEKRASANAMEDLKNSIVNTPPPTACELRRGLPLKK